MADEKVEQKEEKVETVAKADFDAKSAEAEQLRKDLDDVRLEVLSPEYLEFLQKKEAGGGKEVKEEKKDDLPSDEDIEKMSKKDLLRLATSMAEKNLRGEIIKTREDLTNVNKSNTAKEVAQFARTHDDYSLVRPTMYGLSLDPKNADLTLQELYDKSKDYMKHVHTKASDEEKKRNNAMGGEKPGGSADSFEEVKGKSAAEINRIALKEVKEKLGDIPKA